jgi:hypothetical protein
MKNKIAKDYKAVFYRCQGVCRICLDEGDCKLEKLIKKYGLDKIKRLVYNE